MQEELCLKTSCFLWFSSINYSPGR